MWRSILEASGGVRLLSSEGVAREGGESTPLPEADAQQPSDELIRGASSKDNSGNEAWRGHATQATGLDPHDSFSRLLSPYSPISAENTFSF